MIDALARVLPNHKRQKALAALSTMVGAVVLSRLADDPDLAQAFLQAAADNILPGKPAGPGRQIRRYGLAVRLHHPNIANSASRSSRHASP